MQGKNDAGPQNSTQAKPGAIHTRIPRAGGECQPGGGAIPRQFLGWGVNGKGDAEGMQARYFFNYFFFGAGGGG